MYSELTTARDAFVHSCNRVITACNEGKYPSMGHAFAVRSWGKVLLDLQKRDKEELIGEEKINSYIDMVKRYC